MMKSRGDEEEYWNTSKFKAFTFDDDDDELKESKEAVKSLPQLSDQDESDLVEKVSWSGEPVGSISWSVRETAAAAADGGPAFPSRIPADAPNVAKGNSGYSLSSLFKGRRAANVAAFADASGDPSGRILAPEIPKPKSEKQDLIGDWSPQDAVKRMQQGKAVSLERFRCLQDKMRLLDWSVATHDGNVITAVLISLKKSLSKEVLIGELASRQTALRHFLNYLSESGDEALLGDVYSALGRTEDAALLQYKRHLSIGDEEKRRDFLKGCLSLQFSAEDQSQVRDQLSLLERQMVIEVADRQAERGGKAEIFQRFPRRASIPHMPLITTLYYCCFYHYDQPEGSFSSPLNVRQSFKVSAVRSALGGAPASRIDRRRVPRADLGEAVLRDGAERSGQAEVVERRGRALHQSQLAGLHQEEIAAGVPKGGRHPAQKRRSRAGAAGLRGPGGRRRGQDGAGPPAQVSRPRHQHVPRR